MVLKTANARRFTVVLAAGLLVVAISFLNVYMSRSKSLQPPEAVKLPVTQAVSPVRDAAVTAPLQSSLAIDAGMAANALAGATHRQDVAELPESRRSFDDITVITTTDDGAPVPDVNRQIEDRRIVSRIRAELSDLTFRKERGYDIVGAKDCFNNGSGKPGSPMLPVRGINMLIPAGMKVAGVHLAVTEVPVTQGLNIFPTQPPRPTLAEGDGEFVEQDPAIYGSDEIFPAKQAEAVRISRMRGNRYLSIRVNTLRYRPKSGELLMVKSLRVSLDVEPDPARVTDLPRHPRMDESVKSVVVNADLMDAPAYGTAAGEVGK